MVQQGHVLRLASVARARWTLKRVRRAREDNREPLSGEDKLKPSDGLEPSTPSLPSWNNGGKRRHVRVTAGTKAPQA